MVVVAFFGLLNLPSINSASSEPVYGQVIGLRAIEGEGVRFLLDVTLDSGKKVLVPIHNKSAFYKKGRRLLMQKQIADAEKEV